MTDKISREELRTYHLGISEKIFDVIFPRKFYYTKFHYAFKHRLDIKHFLPLYADELYADDEDNISEAKLIACYDHSVTKDKLFIRDYVIDKFGKNLFK